MIFSGKYLVVFNLSRRLFLVVIGITICQMSLAQSNQKKHFIYQNTPLETVLAEWKDAYNISFSYDYDLVKNVHISGNFDQLALEEKMIKAFRYSALEFLHTSDGGYIVKTQSKGFFDKYNSVICGRIIDRETTEPLPFANILLKDTNAGTNSDSVGHFSIEAPFVNTDTIIISYLGYFKKYLPVKTLKNTPCQTVELIGNSMHLSEVVIYDKYFVDVENSNFLSMDNVSSTTFEMEEMDDLVIHAEKDVLQLTQLLPSVSSTDESASQIHIRGGNSGQTLVLFDDIPLYHQGHFFGKLSSVNANIVDKVKVSKEGYSSSYGSRVSGVVDIEGKQKIPLSPAFKIEGSLLSGNVNLETPLFNKKAGLFVSYRHSFSEYFNSAPFKNNFDQIFQNSIISADRESIKKQGLDSLVFAVPHNVFYDFNGKLIWQPNRKEKVSISFIKTSDLLRYSYDENKEYYEENLLKIKNEGINLNWKHNWSQGTKSMLNISYSNYDNLYRFMNNKLIDSAQVVYKNTNNLEDYSLKLSNNITRENQFISFGYQFNQIKEKAIAYQMDGIYSNYEFSDEISGITHTVFTDYRLDLDKIDFNFGMRLNHYNLSKKYYFEPRFIVKTYPFKDFSFKIAGGIYYQTINQIVEFNKLNVEDNFWILARKEGERDLFSIVKNTQYSMGVAFKFLSWDFDLTLFDRYYTGITSRTLRFDTRDFPFYSGNMASEGVELLIQRRSKYFNTIIGYSYNDVKYEFEYPEYPVTASYSQKHLFDIVQSLNYNKFTLSALLKIGSGLPYTGVDSIGYDASDPQDIGYWIEYNSFNSSKLPSYYRVDIMLSWKFQSKLFSGRMKLSLLNVLNRKNYLRRAYSLKFLNATDPPLLTKSDRLGLPFTPNLGFTLLFN